MASSFIANLLLTFVNERIAETLENLKPEICDYELVQYADDTWVALNFEFNVPLERKEEIATGFIDYVIDLLVDDFSLRLSPKTRVFWLENKEDMEQAFNTLRTASSNHLELDEAEDLTPLQLLDEIIATIMEIKRIRTSKSLLGNHHIELDKLNHIYKQDVQEILKRPDYEARLSAALQGFNFSLVRCAPLALSTIIHSSTKSKGEFRQYLLGKTYYSSYDVIVSIHHLCQDNFDDGVLIEKLNSNPASALLMQEFELSSIPSDEPGYFSLQHGTISILIDQPNIIEQISCRALCERRSNYSVAINHLVNELEAICFYFDPDAPSFVKHYKRNHVEKFVYGKGVSQSDRTRGIEALFDCRHTNTVSHSGSIKEPTQKVTRATYTKQKELVERLVQKILQSEALMASQQRAAQAN